MSKKYYWNWQPNTYFMDEDIHDFIEISKKKNNGWWKNLGTTPSLKTHLQYFKEVAAEYFKSFNVDRSKQVIPTVKTCPAIGNGLLDKTILVKLPCDILISFNTDGSFYWQVSDKAKVSIEQHDTDQFYTKDKNPFINKINLKFVLPIVFSSNNDTFIFLQPQFHQQNYPFEVVNGSINRQRIRLAVNTLIEIPKERTEYHLKAGTVLGYMWFDNNKITLEKNDKLTEALANRFIGNK